MSSSPRLRRLDPSFGVKSLGIVWTSRLSSWPVGGGEGVTLGDGSVVGVGDGGVTVVGVDIGSVPDGAPVDGAGDCMDCDVPTGSDCVDCGGDELGVAVPHAVPARSTRAHATPAVLVIVLPDDLAVQELGDLPHGEGAYRISSRSGLPR